MIFILIYFLLIIVLCYNAYESLWHYIIDLIHKIHSFVCSLIKLAYAKLAFDLLLV